MLISPIELARLNFYRASELHGGLVLGQLVNRVRDGWLVQELTQHSAEEVRHSQVWNETILVLGGAPRPVRSTYQRRLAGIVGAPSSIFQVLALTQVFERRVYRHFIMHDRLAGTHPRVRDSLQLMIEEEKHHLSWVKEWLDAEAARRGYALSDVLRGYEHADSLVYDRLLREYEFIDPEREAA